MQFHHFFMFLLSRATLNFGILGIPLLPSNDIVEVWMELINQTLPDTPVSLFKKFKRYIEKTWIVQKLDVLSVHGVPHRTNNSVESYNRHPNFWVLAEHIWETFEDVSYDMF